MRNPIRRYSAGLATATATGVVAATAALVAVTSARWLGPSDRGVVVLVTTLATTLLLVGALGTGVGIRVLTKAEPPLLPRDALRSVTALAALSTVALAALVAGGILVAGDRDLVVPGTLMALLTGVMLLNYVSRELLHGLGRHVQALAGEALANTGVLGFVLVAHRGGFLTASSVLVAMLVGCVLQQGVVSRMVLRVDGRTDPSPRSLRGIVRFSLPATLGPLGQSLISRGDRLVVGVMLGQAPVGIYGAAATMAEVVGLLAVAGSQIMFRKSAESSPLGDLVRQVLVPVVSAIGVIAVVFTAAAPWLFPLLLGRAYDSGVLPFQLLAVAAVLMGAQQLLSAILNGRGRFRDVQQVTIVGLVTLAALCLALVPLWGILGAAVASLVAYGLMAGAAGAKVLRLGPGSDSA